MEKLRSFEPTHDGKKELQSEGTTLIKKNSKDPRVGEGSEKKTKKKREKIQTDLRGVSAGIPIRSGVKGGNDPEKRRTSPGSLGNNAGG